MKLALIVQGAAARPAQSRSFSTIQYPQVPLLALARGQRRGHGPQVEARQLVARDDAQPHEGGVADGRQARAVGAPAG